MLVIFLLYNFGENVQYIYAQQGKCFQGNMDTISHITLLAAHRNLEDYRVG